MEYKDYYKIMNLERAASQEEIKRTYRKLARKYHPDISKEADAEIHFKQVGEAYEVLKDPEKRVAYDRLDPDLKPGQAFHPPPNWNSGFEFSGGGFTGANGGGFSDFFEELFGHSGTREYSAQGTGLNARGQGSRSSGNLYLEVHFNPHPLYRVDGRDLYLQLPVTPWEVALGATVKTPTPGGVVDLKIPQGSNNGKMLRLKNRGIPGHSDNPTGNVYVTLLVTVPAADSEQARALYTEMANTLAFDPRTSLGV